MNSELLFFAAESAAENAYAPYSGFRVGAAAIDKNDRIYVGANIENASYPAGCCAERSALFAAKSQGCADIVALAVCAPSGVATVPCGICLQVISELCPNADIYLRSADGTYRKYLLSQLLPMAFSL